MKRKGLITALAVVFTSVMVIGSAYVGAEPTNQTVNLDGTYHAALGLKTETKNIYRMAYYHKKSAGSDKWKRLAIGDYSSAEYQEITSTFTDVVIKGNGKYTVKLENADFQEETNFSKMQVSTDIPNTGQITFSNMVVKVNGTEVGRFDEPYIDSHRDANGNCCLLIVNKNRQDFQGIDGNIVPTGTENKITVTFNVSGFNYKKGQKPKPPVVKTPEPVQENNQTPEPVTEPPVVSTATPEPVETRPIVNEEIRPAIIITVISIAVISIVTITITVTRRKK